MILEIRRHLLTGEFLQRFGRLFSTTDRSVGEDMFSQSQTPAQEFGIADMLAQTCHEIVEFVKLT